jgi:chromosome segregation ATPase
MSPSQTVEIDLAKILERIEQKVDNLTIEVVTVKGDIKTLDERLSGQIKTLDERLSGQIKTLDERLSGQIKTLDERLSGQIKALDEKVDGLSKRIDSVDFINRGVFIALIIAILGGFAKIFGFIGQP